MEHFKTSAVVLKNISYSETSNIVKLFTDKFGIISCLVKGAKRKNAKIPCTYFNELSILDLIICKNKFSDLYNISEIKFKYLYEFVNQYSQDLSKNCIFMFINEILLKCLKEGTQSEELFLFITDALIKLDKTGAISPEFHIIFLTKLVKYLGFEITGKQYSANAIYNISEGHFTQIIPNHQDYIPSFYAKMIFDALNADVLDRLSDCNSVQIRTNAINYLLKFYHYHIPEIGEIKSVEVLHNILEG
ncbi:MAG: DNA repair protein RecO [Bacteroidales bacterium]|jgi:DNA repair protein RecO (recombination protein O)|nr:DNA repair protein RecO [Bacteroidales bacterium]MDD2205317.1 DNA repair protein RecO [Bacteroidales bacterium]MDD3151745.1 DNA repair protein RecO [Bacteroidales bacterium]MDD3914206.1 DNA repair protein RecO [Bacteroidales bacterium]MDD4634623.1 DNA repair protein RecO [Bacteroidales bacterium]